MMIIIQQKRQQLQIQINLQDELRSLVLKDYILNMDCCEHKQQAGDLKIIKDYILNMDCCEHKQQGGEHCALTVI